MNCGGRLCTRYSAVGGGNGGICRSALACRVVMYMRASLGRMGTGMLSRAMARESSALRSGSASGRMTRESWARRDLGEGCGCNGGEAGGSSMVG